ncbi:Nucleoporin Nup43 [Dissophora globulifera]|nr:Nucleoporin Nup43 [Dissophora globulifera]
MARREIDQFTTSRKVSKVRWLERSTFPEKDLHFATALHLDGKANTIAIWSCQNQRQFEIVKAEDVKSKFNPTQLAEAPHRGEVLDMRVVEGQDSLLVTASSLGEISLYKAKVREGSGSSLENVARHRHHGFPNLGVAEATSVSVRPQALNEIASVGEDSRLVLMGTENIQKTLQRSDYVGAGLTAVCWRSSSSLAVATKIGQVRVFDRRDIAKCVATMQDPQQLHPLTCIAQHPVEVHRLATGNDDGAISIWDVRNMSQPEVKSVKIHNSVVWEVMFHPNQPHNLISCSQDGTLATVNWKQAVNEHMSDAKDASDKHVATYWASIRNVLSVNSVDYHNRANVMIAGSDSGGILHSVQ